jgi:hypothetical protein
MEGFEDSGRLAWDVCTVGRLVAVNVRPTLSRARSRERAGSSAGSAVMAAILPHRVGNLVENGRLEEHGGAGNLASGRLARVP